MPLRRSALGPYELRALLGEGGGGEVYRAWDPRLERDVALKILHEPFERDPERVRAFVAEARGASALNHPNIVAVYDAAVEGGTPYIVSELIDGRSLREELDRGPIPLKRLLDLATQVADGLAAAHDAHIRHGDLKPENVMVTRTGRAKIVDFGLTRATGFQTTAESPATALHAAHPTRTETVAGLVAGTVPYMSPEQARGLAADARADQFAFGLMLFEMAAGRRAFHGDTPAATLDAIVNDDVSFAGLDARVPVALRWIIERCLAKDPEDRYGSTGDLHRDLRTLRDRLPEAVGAAGAANAATADAGRGWRWLRWSLVAAAVSALGAVAAVALRGTPPPDLSALQFTPLVMDPGYQGFPALSPNGQAVAYAADVDGTLQIFTRKLTSTESSQVTHGQFDCKYPFWSPDGQRIYYVSLAQGTDGIYSISATRGPPEVVVLNASRGAISPDNQTIAFLRDDTKVDVVGTAALWISRPGGQAPWSAEQVEAAAKRRDTFGGQHFIEGALAFSWDGLKLGLMVVPDPKDESSFWQFWIVPLPEGQASRRLTSWTDADPRLSSFTWLPDNNRIVLGASSRRSPGSHLWMADLAADRVWPITNGPYSESWPSASRSSYQVVFTQGEPEYNVVEISLDAPGMRPLIQTDRNESDPDLSRDGRSLVYVTDRTGQDEIWLHRLDASGGDRRLVTQADFGDDDTLMIAAPSLSPTGDRVAYLRNGRRPRFLLRLWMSALENGLRTPLQPRAYVAIQGAPTWSPDGRWIAYPEWKDNRWNLMKMRVDATDEPIRLRTDGVANATPKWSPRYDAITWETEQGFVLASPDNAGTRELVSERGSWADAPWLVHAWSHDGRAIFGIKLTDDRHLKLVVCEIATGKTRELRDLGQSPIVNNPVKGFIVSADGRTFITSIAQLPGDLWLLSGLERQPSSWWRR